MAQGAARDSIVVLGAGIIGLQVATVLAERGYGRNITIVAKHFPGDTSIDYTSPWAGANFSAISGSDANALKWDKIGYKRLMAMTEAETGDENFIRRTPSVEYWDKQPLPSKIGSMSEYLENFTILPKERLPEGVAFGVSFTTVTLNAPAHCHFLYRRLQTRFHVQSKRISVSDISDAFLGDKTRLVFNCTGNAARTLGGVKDSKCYPTRGQILLVRAPQVTRNVMRHGRDYETYVIPRPASNGNVILGGFMQKDIGTGDTYQTETDSIWQRTNSLASELRSDQTQVLAAFAGLRPSREGGARVEREDLSSNSPMNSRTIVHNYGAGGTGFQAGYGMAVEGVGLVIDILETLLPRSQARL